MQNLLSYSFLSVHFWPALETGDWVSSTYTTTARTRRDVLDQTSLEVEKLAVTILFHKLFEGFFCVWGGVLFVFCPQARTAKTAKWTRTFTTDFSSTVKEECGKFKSIHCAFTQGEAGSFKTITQKTYPPLNVLHKGNGTSYHKAIPAHQEKVTCKLLSDWYQFFLLLRTPVPMNCLGNYICYWKKFSQLKHKIWQSCKFTAVQSI